MIIIDNDYDYTNDNKLNYFDLENDNSWYGYRLVIGQADFNN